MMSISPQIDLQIWCSAKQISASFFVESACWFQNVCGDTKDTKKVVVQSTKETPHSNENEGTTALHINMDEF